MVWTIGYWPSDDIRTLDVTPAIPANQLSAVPNVSMTFNAANRIEKYNGQSILHDADGNSRSTPTTGGGWMSLSYDSRNRLTAVGTTAYTYNAENTRVGITSPTETTTLVVDPEGALSKVLLRTKNGITTRYVYGAGLQYEVNSAGVATYYHFDQTGNTAALSNQSGAIIERVVYSPYGTIRYRQSGFDTPFLYGGFFGVMTDANGLINMRARYYNPVTMRFLNSDPARDGLNWYAYAGGNPISNSDPTGLEVRVYSSPAFGLRLIGNHAWVYSTETGDKWGRMAKFPGMRPPSGDGGGDPKKDPYFVVKDLNGMSEKQFIEAIKTSPVVESKVWRPPFVDCHTDLEDAFRSLGVAFPGVPGGRHDWIGESSSQYQVTHQRPTAPIQPAPSFSIPQPTFGVQMQQPSVSTRK